jgi:protease I
MVKHFVDTNKPIAAICHGPQILAAFPSYIKGKKLTAYPALQVDLENIGGIWVGDCQVTGAVVDGNLVTGQAWPGHPTWLAKFLELLGTKITL